MVRSSGSDDERRWLGGYSGGKPAWSRAARSVGFGASAPGLAAGSFDFGPHAADRTATVARSSPPEPAAAPSAPYAEPVGASASPQPAAAARVKPSRLLPDSGSGRVGLAVSLVVVFIVGFIIGEGDPAAPLIITGAFAMLYLVWRNILVSWGILTVPQPTRPAAPPAGNPTAAVPGTAPGHAAPAAEPEEASKLTRFIMIVVILVGIGLARQCGQMLGGMF